MGDLNYAFAVRDGFKYAFSEKGLKLTSLFYISFMLYISGLLSFLGPDIAETTGMSALALNIPSSAAAAMTLTGVAIGVTGASLGFRSLGTDKRFLEGIGITELISISTNFLLGGGLFLIAIGIGWMAFILPGFILAGLLAYWGFYTSREDLSFHRALIESWKVTRGNRISSIILVSTLVILEALLSLMSGFISMGGSLKTSLLNILIGAAYATFTLASLAAAFEMMEAETPEDKKLH